MDSSCHTVNPESRGIQELRNMESIVNYNERRVGSCKREEGGSVPRLLTYIK